MSTWREIANWVNQLSSAEQQENAIVKVNDDCKYANDKGKLFYFNLPVRYIPKHKKE